MKPVISKFFQIRDGKWFQKRAEEELAKARAIVEAKSNGGKVGAKKRWDSHNSANGTGIGEPSISHRQNDAPLPQPIPRTITSNFVVGEGMGKNRASMPHENKLALFQKWLAALIGPHGWQIVGVAADPTNPNYDQAVAHCRRVARENGKGWPHQWPARQAAS
jgi:hypothetical protein